jgi:Fe2+ or Zn2+ uptake regulation protein
MLSLMNTCAKYNKGYCIIRYETLQRNLCNIYGETMSRATLYRVLRYLEDHGFIERTKRPIQGDGGKYYGRASMFKLKAESWSATFKAYRQCSLYGKITEVSLMRQDKLSQRLAYRGNTPPPYRIPKKRDLWIEWQGKITRLDDVLSP